MDPEHEKRLQKIEKRVDESTGGEWQAVSLHRNPMCRSRYHEIHCIEGENEGIRIACDMYKSDAVFVANVINDIPWLIERLREAEKAREKAYLCERCGCVYCPECSNASEYLFFCGAFCEGEAIMCRAKEASND